MIPMHYGTFRLSQEPMEEPVERLMAAARQAGVAGSVCVLPGRGNGCDPAGHGASLDPASSSRLSLLLPHISHRPLRKRIVAGSEISMRNE